MKVIVLTKVKRGSFSIRNHKNMNAFFYDEDMLWVDVETKKLRIGLSYPEIVAMRKATLKALREVEQ